MKAGKKTRSPEAILKRKMRSNRGGKQGDLIRASRIVQNKREARAKGVNDESDAEKGCRR